jgi:primosomal protein N' (replication factor Y)
MSGGDRLISVAVPRPLDLEFTYRISSQQAEGIRRGSWVVVPFGRGRTHAWVTSDPAPLESIPSGLSMDQVKTVIEAGPSSTAMPDEIYELCRWTHEYYHSPLGEVLNAAMPAAALGLRSARREPRRRAATEPGSGHLNALTPRQQQALGEIQGCEPGKPVLLHGVTGSGKTEIYLHLARAALDAGRSVLILAPEIALTPQLHERFEAALGVTIGLWHSALPDGQRRDQTAAMLSGELRVVVGARSAVFAPLKDLGLVVVDEEHDPTYKQEDRVRYHARDVAIVRARNSSARILLGSATPSLDTLERVREGKFRRVLLPERIRERPMPEVQIVSLGEEEKVEGIQAPMARSTLQAIEETLAAGQQVMVFLNRRGFAAFLLCEDCSEVAGCPNCSISLTVHRRDRQLRCHVCGHSRSIPRSCSACQSERLIAIGAGTESLEDELPGLLPSARILRLDRDQVTSATRLSEVLESFRRGEANLMLGTQMLVKGHDFPNVTLVVVVLADALFRFPDFRAAERALQILTQVAGRAGRGELPGKVLVQTYSPEHPVLDVLSGKRTVDDFLEEERSLREALRYPPFGRIARIRIESPEAAEARARSQQLARELSAFSAQGLEVLGPSEAFLEKAKGIFRWDILLKSPRVALLHQALSQARARARASQWPILVDVDPSGIG